MTPIISPWWFYLFDVVETLDIITCVFASLMTASLLFLVIFSFVERKKIKGTKLVAALYLISGIMAIFVPSKETCYQMAAASLVTPDNLTITGEAVTDIIDYIVESVDKVLDDEGNNE